MALRIPFGLDRLPRTLRVDDPRLPGVNVGEARLRLNAEALPAETIGSAAGDHAARVVGMRQYLHGLCGDYAPQRLRFVDGYFAAVAAHLAAHRDELARDLRRYDGLYAPEDWLWSALRPLPRAWVPGDGGAALVDFAFWDGARAIAVDVGGSQGTAGDGVVRVTRDVLEGDPLALLALLPPCFRCFWRGETLPRSPFRREIPRGVVGDAANASLRDAANASLRDAANASLRDAANASLRGA